MGEGLDSGLEQRAALRPASPRAEPVLPPGFRLVRRLGDSPLSEVFHVIDDQGRACALKVLRPSAALDPRIPRRWAREAELLQEIRHPHLVHSYGALEIEGRPALLLELVEGPTLRDALRGGPLGWEHAARIGMQIARALERLHRVGAVHRDVKPHNILLDPKRGAVLADLGLVRRREDPTLTRQGAALGSPAYMSPEQARDPSDIDAQADVYSLGASLYHAVSGQPPFLGKGVGEVIHRVLHEDPEPLPESVPAPLARVLLTALAKERSRRYARARDLRDDLGRVLFGVAPRLVTRHRLRRRRQALAGGAAVLLLGGALLRWWPRGGDPAVDREAAPQAPAGAPEPPGAAAEAGGAAPPAGDPAPENSDEAFLKWVRDHEQAWRRYASRGELRRALEEVDALRREPLPSGASERFRHLRQALLRDAEQGILAQAERMAAEAERILARERDDAQGKLQADPHFDVSAWEEGVRELWREARLAVLDFPLTAGGPEPNQRLHAAAMALQSEKARVLDERAELAIPAKRRVVHELLLSGRLAEALAEWDAVDVELVSWSLEGRREASRLQGLRGLPAEAVYQQEAGRLLQTLPGESSERAWLLAHLLWCRGELEAAIAAMTPLAAERWPAERDPAFWVEEWRRESSLAAARAPPPAVPAAPPAAAPPPADPAVALAAELAPALGGAEVAAVNGGVEIAWSNPRWGAEWSYAIPIDRRRWELKAWRVEWRIAPGAEPPRLISWLHNVRLLKSSRLAPPRLDVGGVGHDFGVVPGAAQALEWSNGALWFDGLKLGTWEASGDRQLQVQASAQPEFTPERVWLRIGPR